MQIKELLNKIRHHRSERAFRKLYDHCYHRFFRIAFYYLRRDEWAQEVVLDFFLKLWNDGEGTLLPDDFDSYAFVCLKNMSLNYLKKENRRITSSLAELPDAPAEFASPEDDLLHDELLKVYLRALDELPDRCREVFILVKEDKLSYAQVAEQLSVSTKTVDAHLQKAVKRIKERISAYFSEIE